ncbi:MAG: hypothetical protein Q8K92_12215 [Leadbetterella sp.]|nr:hypothetical protein [Leadbetterella sp.]
MAKDRPKSETAIHKFSEKSLEAVKKNLEVQRKHSAFEFFRKNVVPVPSCKQCIFSSECEYFREDQKHCRAVLELQEEIYSEIIDLDYVRPIDKFIVDRFVKNFCFLIIVERWIAHVSPFKVSDSGLDIQPILSMKTSYERLVLKQADALGIGPQARARLNLTNVQSFCFAEALQRAQPITNQTAKIVLPENDDEEDSADN